MKYLLRISCLLGSCFFVLGLHAQQHLPKLSPLTQLYLQKVKQTGEYKQQGYVYRNSNNAGTYISSLIKVSPGFSSEALTTMGIVIGTKAGNIWTAHVPIEKVQDFTQVPGIEYIQLDEPTFPTLDSARHTTHADSAQAGYGLNMPYSGDGVVVGIVDAGFDYTHPTLFDTTGSGYRVRKVWEQKKTGTPPSGFSFGNELTDSSAMWAAQTDNFQTHGTHVAGIAAGGGFENSANGINTRYRGMAYRSDLVFVGITPPPTQWINTGCSDMIDGMNYVYTYAASKGKPAVVNLSWGCPLGPRDGTSLFSQACDNLTGSGKIFVCSAGNNGDNAIHLQKTFTSSDTEVHTFLSIATNPLGKTTWVDIWGDTAKAFCVKLRLFTGTLIKDSTFYICLDNAVHNIYLIGSNGDTCFVNMVTSSSEFNMKPRVFLEFNNKTSDVVCISVKGTSGKVNMWNSYVYQTTGYYGSFVKSGKPWATPGTTDMTISDIAASKSAITVGAYASKTIYTNVDNVVANYTSYVLQGNIAPFSSHGPTADGRIKPDITGPGLVVGSAVSSYDNTFIQGGADYSSVQTVFTNPSNNRNYGYGMLMGTSMSSPAASGIVALMLQANPALSPQLIKDAFAQTAITDNFTGTLPVAGNTTWGHGKVNAYAAVKRSEQLVAVGQIIYGQLNCQMYPNPNNGRFTIEYKGEKAENLQIKIYDMQGRVVISDSWSVEKGYNKRDCQYNTLSKGTYFVKLSSATGYSVNKMVIE